MKVEFINYSKCSTCAKAKKWLEDNNIDFESRDIVKDNPNEKELREYFQKSKKDLKKLFNTSGIIYREMKLKDKISSMTEDEMLKLLSTDGKLIKRPLIISKDKVLIGFKEKEWKDFFNK